ncbi:MAG: hypothetical protein FWH28_00885 [Clostridiales bacterium]|nr:hypothetical protein [Clostridiales bacterium]
MTQREIINLTIGGFWTVYHLTYAVKTLIMIRKKRRSKETLSSHKWIRAVIYVGLVLGFLGFSIPISSIVYGDFSRFIGDSLLPGVFFLPTFILVRGKKRKEMNES